MKWEEYFDAVFRRGVYVQVEGKQTSWERVITCFDYYWSGIGVGEARSLLRDSGRDK